MRVRVEWVGTADGREEATVQVHRLDLRGDPLRLGRVLLQHLHLDPR